MKSPNFVGLLVQHLTGESHVVQWSDPSVSWDEDYLAKFDVVIVGVAPLTGLGTNRAYGALSILEQLWDDKRLRLLVDAPDPYKIGPATQAIDDHPENLAKDFFSYRKEYREVRRDQKLQERLQQAVRALCYDAWPMTIVPQLPWQTASLIRKQLPNAASLQLVNLDYLLFKEFDSWQTQLRSPEWALENGSHASWLRKTNTSWPVNPLPRTHRKAIVTETMTQLAGSEGTLIVPGKLGAWWSPRFAMSLAVRTPVFTDWHQSQFLGSAWAQIPSAFEAMDADERNDLADEQFVTYFKATQEASWTIG